MRCHWRDCSSCRANLLPPWLRGVLGLTLLSFASSRLSHMLWWRGSLAVAGALCKAAPVPELCRSGLKSLGSRSCQEIEPGGKPCPFLQLAGARCLSLLLLNTAHAAWQLLLGSPVPVGVQLLAHSSAAPELLWVEIRSSHFLLGPDHGWVCTGIA